MEEAQTITTKQPITTATANVGSTRNCLVISSSPFPNLPKVFHNFKNLHIFLISAAHRFFQTLQTFSSQNPLLHNLLSFSSNLHNFNFSHRQIQCRISKTPKSLSVHSFAAILPGDSVAGLVVANGILNFLNMFNSLLIIRLLLTWFPNSPPAIVSPLRTLCDPYLNIFRGIIPPLGGTLDLSPILAFFSPQCLYSTAAALPAELPTAGANQGLSSSHLKPWNLTTMQQKWVTRIQGKVTKNSDDNL